MQPAKEKSSSTNRKPLILFGVFFIVAFLSYGSGNALISKITSQQNMLTAVVNNNFTIVLGFMLMALLHSFVNIALPIILLPIIKPINQRFSYAYFAAAIVATIILIFGAIFLLLLIPLSDYVISQTSLDIQSFEFFTAVLLKGGVYGYHLGMAIWSIGGLFLCAILYQSKLIARFMSVWGIIGYTVLLAGSISEMFYHNPTIELISVIPGGLFELTFSLWLIFLGFSKPTFVKKTDTTQTI